MQNETWTIWTIKKWTWQNKNATCDIILLIFKIIFVQIVKIISGFKILWENGSIVEKIFWGTGSLVAFL